MVTTLFPLAVNAQTADPAVGEPFTIAAGHSQLCLTAAGVGELGQLIATYHSLSQQLAEQQPAPGLLKLQTRVNTM